MNFDEFKKLWKEKNNKIQQVAKGRHMPLEKIHTFWDNLQVVVQHEDEAKKVMQNKDDVKAVINFYGDFVKRLEAMETIPEQLYQYNVMQIIKQVYPEAYKIMPYSQFAKKTKYIAERVRNFIGQSKTQVERPVMPQPGPIEEPQKVEEKSVESPTPQAQNPQPEEEREPTKPEINQEEIKQLNEPVKPLTQDVQPVQEEKKEEKKNEEQPPTEEPQKDEKREEENTNMLERDMIEQEMRETAQEDQPEEKPKETPKVKKNVVSDDTSQEKEEPKEEKPFNWTMILILGGIALVAIFFIMRFMKKRETAQDNVFIPQQPPQSYQPQQQQPVFTPIAQTPEQQTPAPEEQPRNMDEYAKTLVKKVQSGKRARRPEEIWGNRS